MVRDILSMSTDLNAAEVEVCLLSHTGDTQRGVSTKNSMFVINSYQINLCHSLFINNNFNSPL